MSLSKPNASPATLTKNRTDPCPVSGLCVTCIDGCPGPCEVAKSAIRGSEVIYPAPFGVITTQNRSRQGSETESSMVYVCAWVDKNCQR